MANIYAYTSGGAQATTGSYGTPINCGVVVQGTTGSVGYFTIKTTSGTRPAGSYVISLSDGATAGSRNQYRLGATAAACTGATWGASVTLTGAITTGGTNVYVQMKADVGATTGIPTTRAHIVLPQDGIV